MNNFHHVPLHINFSPKFSAVDTSNRAMFFEFNNVKWPRSFVLEVLNAKAGHFD